MTEDQWRALARNYPLSALRSELYEELCSALSLRREGQLEEVDSWLDEGEEVFEQEYETSLEGEDPEPEELVLLAEMFSSEGVEAWMEAFEKLRQGDSDEEVLFTAQRGQRYLLLVKEMAAAYPVGD